jgi:hypothetical protein
MNNNEFDRENEADRLLAIARMEQVGFNHFSGTNHPVWGPGGEYTALLLEVAARDPSPLVRAAALRALFHEPGEDWCFSWGGPEGPLLIEEVRRISQDWPWERIDGRVAIELLKQGSPMEWRYNNPDRH